MARAARPGAARACLQAHEAWDNGAIRGVKVGGERHVPGGRALPGTLLRKAATPPETEQKENSGAILGISAYKQLTTGMLCVSCWRKTIR